MHNLKEFLLLNSLHNIIAEQTRQLTLLDPIIVHEDMSTLSQGSIQVPNEISEHCATYVHIPFEYTLHDTFTRNVWRDVFYVRREVDLMKTVKVNAYIMHIFGKIELLSLHAT